MRLLFRGARLVDGGRDGTGDLLVASGRISKIARPYSLDLDEAGLVVDARGLVLMPAFVDLHAHLRDPGFPDKEVLESGCLAAAAGGYGTLVAMANTSPPVDGASRALAARSRARALGLVDYYPALTMTRALAGTDHSHLDGLETLLARPEARAGLRLLSDDGRDVADEGLFRSVLARAAALDLAAFCHCEIGAASPPEGADPLTFYAAGSAREADRRAETAGVERALRLARETGCRLHLAHLSTRESVQLLRIAKAAAPGGPGRPLLSCEVTPHHLGLGLGDAERAGAAGAGRVNPWLRGEDDRLALAEGLRDGTIDCIATDHAPHSATDKARGAPGFSGLETAFALSHETLVRGGVLGLGRLSALMSARPAEILGLGDRGRLESGLRADLVLLESEAEVLVDPPTFRSRGGNSLLAGRSLHGKILMTIHEGRIVHDQS